MGNLRDPKTVLALVSLLATASLMSWGIRGAMLIGILGTTLVGAALGMAAWKPEMYSLADLSGTALKLDIASTLSLGLVEIVFVFLFVDLFDNVGTLVAVGKKARLFNEANEIPRVNRILLCDASATIAGSLSGTSTVVSYIEGAAA
jgi:AGZA family xanthine/uracil permease-like MFS transporter